MKNDLIKILNERLQDEEKYNKDLYKKVIFASSVEAKQKANFDLMYSNGRIAELEYLIELIQKK